MGSYWFVPRPKGLKHGHPFLVFDCQDRLHLPLTVFGKEASARLSPKTVQTYLHSILPWFTWLETDVLILEAEKMKQLLRACELELREIDQIIAYRKDERHVIQIQPRPKRPS